MEDAVGAYLREHVRGVKGFRTVLNNHSTNNPNKLGGPISSSIADNITLANGSDGETVCTLHLANSFTATDQNSKTTLGKGKTVAEATNEACLAMFVLLLLEAPEKVRLIAKHWSVPVNDIREFARGLSSAPAPATGSEPLPDVATRQRANNYQPPGDALDVVSAAERQLDIVSVLRDAIECDKGDGTVWTNCMQKKHYQALDRFVTPGGLKAFIQRRPEFTIVQATHGKAWGFKLAQ